jgi:hypothetical protein
MGIAGSCRGAMGIAGGCGPLRRAQVECPTCGTYELTLGAIEHLRTSEQLKTAAGAVISRERQSGVEMPQINLSIIRGLRGY